MADTINQLLRRQTEALVKSVGVEAAATVTGRSKTTLGRYYAPHEEHAGRFIPVDAVARLEQVADYPYVTGALAEIAGLTISLDRNARPDPAETGQVNDDVVAMSQRFAMLMASYADAIADNIITPAEAQRMLAETQELQRVLIEMKLHLEAEISTG
ncbi:phage regulatory CII family protein [Jannaschia marina]|uniref:phage regulatory CII family protein n=1 Tax=Jannaschia marina TaxID=2741674 RepID=UPI0015CB0652|nr:phage regulatory CII family protein [Jannaschia marina]